MRINKTLGLGLGPSLLASIGLIAGCGSGRISADASGTQPSLAPTPAIKAAMELGSAQTLEKSRKTKKAIEAYRRIMDTYPESPQAEIAREKVKSLARK